MRLVLVALAVCLAVPSLAQAPAPPGAGGSDKSILDELEAPIDGYAYEQAGRRDPFVSLHRPLKGGEGGVKPPGLEGFLIQELALKGIVKTPEGFVSMLQGPDNKSYFVRLGQRVYDGEVIAMDMTRITFRQDVTDPLSPVRTREVVKSLYPSEEAIQ